MVKNTGGNKGKKIARKDTYPIKNKMRYSEDDDEVYAIVIKMLGNCQCHVVCLDGNTRICIIRKKFTGKHKHKHLLQPGVWVLVGLRDWESRVDKCDLLECYNESDKQTLLQQSHINLELLQNEEKKIEGDEVVSESDYIVFTTEDISDICFDDI